MGESGFRIHTSRREECPMIFAPIMPLPGQRQSLPLTVAIQGGAALLLLQLPVYLVVAAVWPQALEGEAVALLSILLFVLGFLLLVYGAPACGLWLRDLRRGR